VPDRHYDLAVLGAGSGGLAAAQRAARHGARVVVFEPGFLGGTCVNVGCVPKKAMWLAAQAAENIEVARDMGFDVDVREFDWSGFVGRREAYISRARARYQAKLDELGIHIVPFFARFGPDGAIHSDGGDVTATHRLIATGSRPQRLHIPGFDIGGVSDDFFALRAPPKRVAIVGSGYIAVEMAGLLQGLGSEVTVLVRGACVLGHFDPEISLTLTEAMRARGVNVHCGVLVGGLERGDDGIRVQCQSGTVLEGFDWLLWALGRTPNTGGIGLEALGVETRPDGHVVVDGRQNTSVPGVYAIGDAGSQKALTPVAIATGRSLADRLFGNRAQAAADLDHIPTVAFSHPPVASCGMTEPQARHVHGDAVRTFVHTFRPMAAALAGRDDPVLIKMVCLGEDEKVIGLHMVGTGVDEMLQGFAVAIRMGATRRDFNETIAIHPTVSEEISLIGV
jgi:glutathione reductase (NADPH)